MTDSKPKITPPPHLMLTWQEEARDEVRDVANHFDRQSIQMIKAASWGWQQRDASVPNELQEARDEELGACCAAIDTLYGPTGSFELHCMRRPKPPSLKELALETLRSMRIDPVVINGINVNADVMTKYDIIRRALEALPD